MKNIFKVAKSSTIFASNTSSIPIGEIAKSTKRLDRFCGLHFFNPVPVMKLLEVVRTADTSEDTYNTALAFGKKLGRKINILFYNLFHSDIYRRQNLRYVQGHAGICRQPLADSIHG